MNKNILSIFSGESLASYIYRLCKAFYFDSAIPFVDPWNISKVKLNNNEFSTNELEQISNFVVYDKEILYKMTGDYWRETWGTGLYNKIIQKNKIKFCPCCVINVIMHKKIWSIVPVAICPEHKTMLIEHCQGCHCFISMDDYMFGFCSKCNFNFLESVAQEVDDKSIFFESQSFLIQRIHNNVNNYKKILEEYSPQEYFNLNFHSYHLLSGMRSFIDFGNNIISPFNNKKDKFKDSISAATAFGNVFWMYQEFPKNFYTVLELFSAKGKQIYYQKPQFEKLFKENNFETIHKAYNEFWIEKFNSGQIRKDFSIFKSESSLFNQVQSLRKEDIKKRFGLTYQAIAKLDQNGFIQVQNIRKGNNTRYLINKASVETTLKVNNLFITRREAAQILGIQKDSIPKLIRAGFLEIRKTPAKRPMIYKPEIKRLLKRCRGKKIDGTIQGIQFHKALIKYSINNLKIVDLIEFTLNDILHPLTNVYNGTLADAYFCEEELKQCMVLLKQEKQIKKGYYMQDVMSLLRVGEKSVVQLMKLGVIEPPIESVMNGGRKHYFFSKHKIDDFLKNHLTIEDASKQFSISTSTIRMYLKTGKLTDAMKGACRSYRISKSELSRIALAK